MERAVCEVFDVTPEELRSKAKPVHISDPRQVAMAICYQLGRHGEVDAIARHYNRERSTVLWAVRAVAVKLDIDPHFRARYDQVKILASLTNSQLPDLPTP